MARDLRDHRDLGAGARQDHGVDAGHVGGDERGERAEALRPDAFLERNDDAHARSSGLPAAWRRFDDGSTWHGAALVPQRAACRNAERRSERSAPDWERRRGMVEIIRTNDLVVLGFVQSLLERAEIPVLVADGHISVLEGSIGAFPRRLLVPAGPCRAGPPPHRRGGACRRAAACLRPSASDRRGQPSSAAGFRLRQPRRGHRAGTDAVLLAALVAPSRARPSTTSGPGVGAVGLDRSRRRTAASRRVRRARARARGAVPARTSR